MVPHYVEEVVKEEEMQQKQQDCKQNVFIRPSGHLYMYLLYPPQHSCAFICWCVLQTAHQTESKHQLLAKLDTVMQMYRDKDKEVLGLKEELRDKDKQVLKIKEEPQDEAKQEEPTSISDQFDQWGKEMLEQEGTQIQTRINSHGDSKYE